MAWVYADRILDTSTTTGTGSLVVSGTSPLSWRTFSTSCAIGDTFFYTIVDPVTGAWETGDGTYSALNTVARTTVRASSNAGALVTFAANAKSVFLDVIARYFTNIEGEITVPAGAVAYGDTSGTIGVTGVLADLAWDATNKRLGLGQGSPISALHVRGLGQTTPNYVAAGAHGATLYVQDTGSAAGTGGAVMFGDSFGPHHVIKSHALSGTGPLGDLVISGRRLGADTTFTEQARFLGTGGLTLAAGLIATTGAFSSTVSMGALTATTATLSGLLTGTTATFTADVVKVMGSATPRYLINNTGGANVTYGMSNASDLLLFSTFNSTTGALISNFAYFNTAGALSLTGAVVAGPVPSSTVPGTNWIQAPGIWAVAASGGQGAVGAYDKTAGNVGAYLYSGAGAAGIALINNAGAFTAGALAFSPTALTTSLPFSGTTATFSGAVSGSVSSKFGNSTTNSWIIGVASATKGVRIGADATGGIIDGVDNTLQATYQPLTITASSLVLNAPMNIAQGIASGTTATFSGRVTASEFWSGVDVSTYGLNAGRFSVAFARVAMNTRGAYGWAFQCSGTDAFYLDPGGYGRFGDTVAAGRIGVSATWGSAQLTTGGANNTGYVAFFQPDNTRRGYIGFGSVAGTEISYVNDRGGDHVFQGNLVASMLMRIGGLNYLGLGGNVRLGIKGNTAGATSDWFLYCMSSTNAFLFGVREDGGIYGLTHPTSSSGTEVVTAQLSRAMHGPGSSFSAVMQATDQTIAPSGSWTIQGWGEYYDPSNAFNATTGRWQPNVSGHYRVTGCATMAVDGGAGAIRVGLYRESSGNWLTIGYVTTAISQTATFNLIFWCAVGETYIMHVENISSTAGAHVYGSSLYTSFSADFVGPA